MVIILIMNIIFMIMVTTTQADGDGPVRRKVAIYHIVSNSYIILDKL